MELYFNELSIIPTGQTPQDAIHKISNLLSLMKALREYGVQILRTHDKFYAEDLGGGYSCSNYITDKNIKKDMQILLKTVIRNPYIPEVDTYEAEMFMSYQYETDNHLGISVSVEGLACSHINNVPTVSFFGYSFWEQDSLVLKMLESRKLLNTNSIINLSSLSSIQSLPFKTWIEENFNTNISLNTYNEIINKFPPSQYTFDNKAISDIIEWYYDDKRFLNRVIELIEDISIHPYIGGKGKTESLKGNKQSKRIIKKDRVIYTYSANMIYIYQCKGHYDDT